MISKTFVFSKIQKTTEFIEKNLNAFLENHTFKYATQNESYTKGKFIISVFGDEKPGTVKAKVFKDQDPRKIDDNVNKFLKNHVMKFVSQTFVGSNVYTVLFYELPKTAE